jgi:hypothetical protein
MAKAKREERVSMKGGRTLLAGFRFKPSVALAYEPLLLMKAKHKACWEGGGF